MKTLVELMQEQMPVAILDKLDLRGKNVGLVIVDEVDGFCTAGCGALAPPVSDPVINDMVKRTNALARIFADSHRPILVLQDTHKADRPEPPHPPHCIEGTGHELLVDKLKWLYEHGEGNLIVEFVRKDCINGFIGAEDRFFEVIGCGNVNWRTNSVVEWMLDNNIEAIVVVGICADICDQDFVQTVLSARNHYVKGRSMLGLLKDVVVLVPACSTYDLPVEIARTIPNVGEKGAHPRGPAQHIGLWQMQGRGAILTNDVVLD